MERVNARTLEPATLCPSPSDLAVVDVSFISLGLVLGPISSVLRDGRRADRRARQAAVRGGQGGREGRRRARPGGPPARAPRDRGARRGGSASARGRSSRRRSAARRATASSSSTCRRGRRAPRSTTASTRPWTPRGSAGRERDADRLRVQPDHRAGARAARARGRLVPDARHRPVGGAGRRLGRRSARAARRRTSSSCSAATARSCGRRSRSPRSTSRSSGINLGKVGFLSKAEAHELERVLDKLRAGAYDDPRADGARAADPARPAGTPAGRSPRSTTSSVARGSLARVVRLDGLDRRVAPRDVHRGRPRRREPDRFDRLLVLGRRPDPRPAAAGTSSSRRSPATCRRSARSSCRRARSCAAGSSTRSRRSCRIDGREDRRIAGRRRRRGARARAADPVHRAGRGAAVLGPAAARRWSCCRRDATCGRR